MPFITFIYRVDDNPQTYYGKYCVESISDDHEGLDTEVKYVLIDGLKKYRHHAKNAEPREKIKVKVGILSFSSNRIIPTYSTDSDIEMFDFYYTYDAKIYINGKRV